MKCIEIPQAIAFSEGKDAIAFSKDKDAIETENK
jgi:hypothetical protein